LELYIYETHFKTKGGIANYNYILEEEKYHNNLTGRVENLICCGYMFITYNFLKAIGKKNYDWEFDNEKERITYKVAEGKHIYMSGF